MVAGIFSHFGSIANWHLYRILKVQNFLISEAPQVNNTLNRIVSRANFFRMYAGMNDAISSENAVIENGKILALMFQGTDDNSQSFAVISFDEGNSRLGLLSGQLYGRTCSSLSKLEHIQQY